MRLPGVGVQFIEQTEQRGTGHAIQQTRAAVQGYENLIVLSGDVPLIGQRRFGPYATFTSSGRQP